MMVFDRLMRSHFKLFLTRLLLHAVSMMDSSSLVRILEYMFEMS